MLLLIFAQIAHGQTLEKYAKLPSKINESSGITVSDPNKIWTFNDSGGASELYQIDTLGHLTRTLKINKAWNRDWEDITKDVDGNIYIGNIGNNGNASKDLTIFKISNPDAIEQDAISATLISFRFEDQKEFPPDTSQFNYDCEAMIWFNQQIYLFTKHRSFPMATNLYRIPAEEGAHIAKKIGTFSLSEAGYKPKEYWSQWITAAAMSPNEKTICLLNGSKLWVFYDFENDNFFDGKYKLINLGKNTQKEAVCFTSDTEVYITDEYWKSSDTGGNLYKLDLKSVFKK